jgi:hypothetical protein
MLTFMLKRVKLLSSTSIVPLLAVTYDTEKQQYSLLLTFIAGRLKLQM